MEYFGVATGLLYLFLEIRQHRAMWAVGILSSLVYVYVFFTAKVYAAMGLNIYNVLISIYGFRLWSLQGRHNGGAAILYMRLTWRFSAVIFPALIAICAFIYYVLDGYTDSPIPLADAIVTGIGIVATWMLARRIMEHWIFWIAADGLSVYMYYALALYPTMLLYLCYTALAFAGYYIWKKKGIETDDAL
ncbi:MAG: nicotinamide riboside transporter PnuC [Tannerellaceae bacterium]|nr:nicotinamide riboside transporter PnuC [Tannerellaceae bacterium]